MLDESWLMRVMAGGLSVLAFAPCGAKFSRASGSLIWNRPSSWRVAVATIRLLGSGAFLSMMYAMLPSLRIVRLNGF